ncbi:hypothetical protein E2C01_003229 [Portunus trituberculatus]|uniref:Uncharacterized protein n=1 Tax=Portunus trituberculatus TaxID=210409 RepID=A0A5B7CLN0_PORTR|nr:hypothetical protein [Portunus trituberculatus]
MIILTRNALRYHEVKNQINLPEEELVISLTANNTITPLILVKPRNEIHVFLDVSMPCNKLRIDGNVEFVSEEVQKQFLIICSVTIP